MKRTSLFILTFLILGLLISLADANAVNPPASIKIAGYVSSHDQIGIWWINPTDTDFRGTQVWFDNVYIGEKVNPTRFYYSEFLSVGNHIFSSRTVDTSNNVNGSWINITITNHGFFTCSEEWFCYEEYCGVSPTPTPTPTPTVTVTETPVSWENQTFNPSTDICTITADVGETWIKWDAVCNTTVEVMYYIDGKALQNTTPYGKLDPDRLILSDLNSLETHNLKIYYLGNIVAQSTVETLPSWYMILFFVILSVALSLTGLLFITTPLYRIILGGLAISIALWMMTITTGWMLAIPVLPGLLAGIVIILALYEQIITSWS